MRDDCIIWKGYKRDGGKGYGTTTVSGGRLKYAHRIAWEKEKGPVPEGLMVLHTCDTPPCVNVEHLFLGTQKDNMEDKVRKGRQSDQRGERSHQTKLTENDVKSIRVKRILGLFSVKKLADWYGVSVGTIQDASEGRTWKHLDFTLYVPSICPPNLRN